MRVASLLEEVQSAQDKRSALYQSYDDAIDKFKANKDAVSFVAARKKIDSDYKQLTQQITNLQNQLKNEGSELSDKVKRLQDSHSVFKKLKIPSSYLVIMLNLWSTIIHSINLLYFRIMFMNFLSLIYMRLEFSKYIMYVIMKWVALSLD